MRIRTLKPEFWTHEELGNLPDFTQLLAIGLLNYSDDEGYFDANPMMIRGALFPLREDYRSITVALRELSSIGYIEILKTTSPPPRFIGRVVKFTDHQVINKASPSKRKACCDSGSATVVLPEDYRPERKGREQGTGNRERKGKLPLQSPNGDELPQDFEQFWEAYPRHDDMKSALSAWKRCKPVLDDVLAGIAKYKKSGRWADKKFVPLPTTFINKERYDDEL